MKKVIGIMVVLMLVMTTIPITGLAVNVVTSTPSHAVKSEKTKFYWLCYIEVEGVTYAGFRRLFFPHLRDNNTFCGVWRHRFDGNATVSIYRSEGGKLLLTQTNVREFYMVLFLGSYNYQGNPLILKGRVLCIRLFDQWTSPG
jgi:hypothetical protein